MKNLFSFNLDEKTELSCESPLLKQFTVRKIGEDAKEAQKSISDKMEELEGKWALPTWLVYLRAIFLGFGTMLLASSVLTLMGKGKGAFAKVWFNLCFSFGVVLTFIGAFFLVFETLMKAKVEKSDDYKKAVEHIATLIDESRASLGVPENAKEIDVFFFPYTLRDGEMKDSGVFKYLNRPMRLFSEGEFLCLSDEAAVYGIEKKLFRRILTDPKKTGFTLWNKKDSHLKEPYKSYKINLDHYGVYHVKNVCSVQFTTRDEEKFEIVVPPYEVQHFEALLDVKIREMDE